MSRPEMNMEEKIWIYPELPPDERREVEEYVRTHPRLKASLARAKRLRRALETGGVLHEEPPGDEALAFLAVMHSVDEDRMPAELREALTRLRDQVAEDANLRMRYEDMSRRRDELDAVSDADAQLRRLTESSFRGAGPIPAAGRITEPASDARPSALRRPVARTALVVLGLAAIYAGLFAVGLATRPHVERLAFFDRSDLVLEGYDGLRGSGDADAVSEEVRLYLDALDRLRAAETSVLGLFPRYQEEHLDGAARLLQQVLDREPEESFLADEARYLLGKTRLAQGNPDSARALLETVAVSGGRNAAEAARLLQEIDG